MGTDNQDFELPELNPLLKLFPGPKGQDGAPTWSLHDPLAGSYYKIKWPEFECLSRFGQCKTGQELVNLVNQETTLEIDIQDVIGLVEYLNREGLLDIQNQKVEYKEKKKQALWQRLVHNYLFFSVPITKPEPWLQAALPYVQPLMTRTFFSIAMAILLVASVLTLQRIDEFLNTFIQMFSLSGIVMGFLVFAALKVFHELGHAFMATKYGVKVPHMGVAFIVMYPVLYTEVTNSWSVSSRRSRVFIALAGIMTELSIAGIFLMLWNIMPSGSLAQSVAFSVVAISLIGSLFVNLNPLMRFDGYFILSDLMQIDNMQPKAIAFARWSLRRLLFGLKDEPPENLPEKRAKFLTTFGYCLLTYRFFLFLGIALLVYMVFFKPLGLFLMLIELLWFIILPILSEIKVWWDRRADIFAQTRTKATSAVMLGALLFFVMPVNNNIQIPAIYHASKYTQIFAPRSAQIKELHVSEGQNVEKGELLLVLHSEQLQNEIEVAQIRVRALKDIKRQTQRNTSTLPQTNRAINEEIQAAINQLQNLERQEDKLNITAPFDGVIRDLKQNIQIGRYVQDIDLLLRIINSQKTALTAYVNEQNLPRITLGSHALFYANNMEDEAIFTVRSIDQTNVENIFWSELSSVFGGPIASEKKPSATGQDLIVPRQSLYKITLETENKAFVSDHIKTGVVRINAESQSYFMGLARRFVALIIRETGFN